MRRLAGLAVIAVIALAAVIIFKLGEKPADTVFCESDSDCVAAQCCHPTSAVNKKFAPDCTDVICTMECRPDTIDCGYGEIKCIDSKCKAVMK